MNTAREELFNILNNDEMNNACVLILANKMDLPNAMSIQEISNRLQLNEMSSLRNKKWRIQATCATNGDGLFEGMDWLAQTLHSK